MTEVSPILSIQDLSVQVGRTKILDHVSLDVTRGNIVGVVGGSGSGKTTLGLSVLNLLPTALRIAGGRIIFSAGEDPQNIFAASPERLRRLRGGAISMVFQEPLSAFDPLFTIGAQIDETLAAHTELTRLDRRERIMQTLIRVEIDDPQRIAESYPHQLSGGLRQRAMIAQAIACGPSLIIADEPTSSLDVTIQARIMRLLRKLNEEEHMTIVVISHDLGLVGHLADEIAVMSEGRIIESGNAAQILSHPKQAYTKKLLEAFQ